MWSCPGADANQHQLTLTPDIPEALSAATEAVEAFIRNNPVLRLYGRIR